MTKQPKTLSTLKSELLAEFRNEIYGKDDALFDRAGNNVSTQVENIFSSAIDRTAEKTAEAEEDVECSMCGVHSSEHQKIFGSFHRGKWLGRGK